MSTAQRYHLRSPRYVLQTTDDRLLRFASMDTRGQSVATKVLNLSESGLAFEIHRNDAPSEGDVLKVEFDVPRQSKIACFATVVRVEPKGAPNIFNVNSKSSDPSHSSQTAGPNIWHGSSEFGHAAHEMIHLVGLQFRNLPTAYRRLLAQGLKDRVTNEVIIDWKSFRRKQLASLAGLSFATFGLLAVLAFPCRSWLDALKSWFSS